jgi:plasmid stabilization system protein ParE
MGAPGEIGNPALKGLRLAGERVRRVPYFYVVAGDTVRVIRILHGKLDIDRILGKESVDDDKLH